MRRYIVAGLGLGFLAAVVGSTWAQQGAGEKAGEKLDRAIENVKKGVKGVAEEVRESFAKTKASVNAMGVESRLYGRLHWDKSLNSATIEVQVDRDGVATLRGAVTDGLTKTKALSLANETVGVNRVIDRLTVPASETPAPKP